MIVRIPAIVPETPAWADTFGVDVYGIFAGVTVGETTQILRWIEPGRFIMGSPNREFGRFADEGPQHEVTIRRGFWFGQTPVTQAFYEALTGTNPSHFQGDGQRPVENVDWDDAAAFCECLNKIYPELHDALLRLPSEAEWEYACRAGTKQALYSGNESTSETERCPHLDKLAWYAANSRETTHPVGEKQPNRWGLYDMLGNIWEWCEDGWHGNYQGAPSDGTAWAAQGAARVRRGGSVAARARLCRNASRNYCESGNRSLGFRLVLAPRFQEDAGPFS
ncbi:MAG: formylglycine-generating enzyme family protein [Pirellulaceae bacterium]|nr:formylglycine-generating enzyme family protein [Pirellulaceae bacterium]